MLNEFYKELIQSFHPREEKDYNAVCSILDRKTNGSNVVVVTDDPYLLFLVFTSLIRYYGMRIHILNPVEGMDEVQRLLNGIEPNYVVVTDPLFKEKLEGYKTVIISGETISNEEGEEVEIPEEINFSVVNYTPYPTKIQEFSSEMFHTMVHSIRQDLCKFNLIDGLGWGLIPFITYNPDYLLYFIAVKTTTLVSMLSLPTKEEYKFVIENKNLYLQLNASTTMFIPKKEFFDLWEEKISSIFESKFIFKSYLKRNWLVNMLIKRRLRKLFKGFKNVLIIGTLDNAYMTYLLKNLSFVRFYSVFPIHTAMMYGPISQSLETVILSTNEFRQDTPIRTNDTGQFKGKPVVKMSFRLFHPKNGEIYTITDQHSRFVEDFIFKENGENVRRLFHIGNVNNSFDGKKGYVFPETLEKVINSYPFIRHCVLLTFKKRMTLVIHPDQNVLDSNRINYGMFNNIVQKQIDELNRKLPEDYKIQGFVITTGLIEQNRNGEIIRFPFNYCNKL